MNNNPVPCPSEAVPSRPDRTPQLDLEARNQLNIGPGAALHDVNQRRVIDSDTLTQSAQPKFIDRLTHHEGNPSRGFDGNVGAGDIGPVDSEVDGVFAPGSNHESHAMSVVGGYGYNHAPEMLELINAYLPRKTTYWKEVRPLVIEVARTTPFPNWDAGRELMKDVYEFIVWAWTIATFDLDLTAIFRSGTIGLYLSTLTHRSASSLSRVDRRLMVAMHAVTGAVPQNRPVSREDPSPYTDEEVATWLSKTQTYSTERMRTGALRIFALAAGGGLTISDCAHVRHCDIAPDGRTIEVLGKNPRRTYVRPLWAEILATESNGSDELFILPQRNGQVGSRFLRNFVKSLPRGFPNTNRLRSTWAVDLLRRGISAQDLLSMTGHVTFQIFDRHLPYLNSTPFNPDQIDSLFETQVNA